MTRVTHLTPHLGGGVGRALSSLMAAERLAGAQRQHEIICLEVPEKSGFLDQIREQGASVCVAPSRSALLEQLAATDLVQLEFWNHPATLKALCEGPLPPMRLLVWCHVSGLHFPRIPPGLVALSDRFLLSSGCSWQSLEMASLPAGLIDKVSVASSAAGLERLPLPRLRDERCRFGYLGSLNFAKLHPDYVALLSEIREPGFSVRMIGDQTNREQLEQQCAQFGQGGRLDFAGYREEVVSELQAMEVMLYLLNPCHYGTAEIALLEAMAMGVVPVVMPNAAELQVVEHGVNGLVVSNARELAAAVRRLIAEPDWRRELGVQAARRVRARDTLSRMATNFGAHYRAVLAESKRSRRFEVVFGDSPARWFQSFVREREVLGEDGRVRLPAGPARHLYLEKTKGSARHFHQHFPGDVRLAAWANSLHRQAQEETCLTL